MAALLILFPLLLAGVILYLLSPKSAAGRSQIWALTALAPLVMAFAAAWYSQGQVAAQLQAAEQPRPTVITITTLSQAGEAQTLQLRLQGEQAACFEQTRRLTPQAQWLSEAGPILLSESTEVTGELPPPEVAGQLSVLGRINCRQWVQAVTTEEQTAAEQE